MPCTKLLFDPMIRQRLVFPCQSRNTFPTTDVPVSSIATLSNGTLSHPMDVAVFGVAMVINETLFHPTDVRVRVERGYILGRDSFIAWQRML